MEADLVSVTSGHQCCKSAPERLFAVLEVLRIALAQGTAALEQYTCWTYRTVQKGIRA